mmetsp:Transcript_2161/g.8506  ORF Transcript_2161/g.8506 Transcript_2161/m.8506 type:complete len:204 (+) Transcript_2161:964-1575(+)
MTRVSLLKERDVLIYQKVVPKIRSLRAFLLERDLVPEAERDALRLGADADVPPQLPVRGLLLHRDVHQRVLPEHRLRVQVRRQVVALAVQRAARGEASHVGGGDDVVQKRAHVGDGRVHRHLVLPLELRPHRAERGVVATRRVDVVHDVDVDVVQHNHVAVRAGGFVHDVAENHPRLRRRNLDVRADVFRLAHVQGVVLRPFH